MGARLPSDRKREWKPGVPRLREGGRWKHPRKTGLGRFSILWEPVFTVCLRKQGAQQAAPLIHIFVVLIVVGVLLWLVNRFIPMAGSIKSILNAVVVILVVVWLLEVFGLMSSLASVHVGR